MVDVYKILLAGTHGNGKSALAVTLQGEYKRRNIEATSLKEASTEASERGLPINDGTTLDSQLWILHHQFAQEILYGTNRPGRPHNQALLCDRGIDNYCYLERKFGRQPGIITMIEQHVAITPYHKIYLLPIVDEVCADNQFRDTKTAFREEMAQLIPAFLTELQLPFTTLPIPKKEDPFRSCWVTQILDETLPSLRRQ